MAEREKDEKDRYWERERKKMRKKKW